MSRQFQFFLLPTDIERIADELRSRFDGRFLSDVSEQITPAEIRSPVRVFTPKIGSGELQTTSVNCYFARAHEADIKVRYIDKRRLWSIQAGSEAIEFSGCHFDGQVLLAGRFHLQTDLLIGHDIFRKRREFLDWADRVFRWAKKRLQRFPGLDAYVGEDAVRWRQSGVRFAWLWRADGTPMYAPGFTAP